MVIVVALWFDDNDFCTVAHFVYQLYHVADITKQE